MLYAIFHPSWRCWLLLLIQVVCAHIFWRHDLTVCLPGLKICSDLICVQLRNEHFTTAGLSLLSICLQVWNEECAEDEVLAMVVRTGLCTTMGSMLRQVMNPLNQGSFGEWTSDLFLPVCHLDIMT